MTSIATKLKEKTRSAPHLSGVYSFYDRFGNLLYVGKAKDLKKRLAYYVRCSKLLKRESPKIATMIQHACNVAWTITRNEQEALLLESSLVQERRPKYNTVFRDDKRFLLIKVDKTLPLPTFSLVRHTIDDHARYFGPFPKSRELRHTLIYLRDMFGILLENARPKPIALRTLATL